jgi:acyl-CoA thioesterase FadM
MVARMLLHALRVVSLLVVQSLRPKVDASRPFINGFRAWPWHCDSNLHINNARYLFFMEQARWAWSLRTGLLRRVFQRRWNFLVAGVSIVYRRPLPWWRAFSVRTSLIAASDPWLYVEHDFVDADGKVAARAVVRATVRRREGAVPVAEVLEGLLGITAPASAELTALDQLTRHHLARINEG